MQDAGYCRLRDLKLVTRDRLLRIPNVGPAIVDEVRALLASLGIQHQLGSETDVTQAWRLELQAARLDQTDLRPAIVATLLAAAIYRLTDLKGVSADRLICLRRCGPTMLAEIRRVLDDRGIEHELG